MTRPGRKTLPAWGRAGPWVLLGLVAAGLALYFGVRRAGPHEPDAGVLATGPVGGPRRAAAPESTAATGLRPASAPATTTAPHWSPRRFTARQDERDEMVRVIRGYGLEDQAVLKVMAAVPRHEFVPEEYSRRAYDDTPLPIGYGQTISQPYMVAEMTRLLKLTGQSRVLEIGTGSGYQAAVLAHFTPRVYSIEIVKPLADAAANRLKRLGYEVVQVRAGDGYYGWEDQAPFDAIIVTAAAGQIPPPLIRQLKPGGRIIIPVGGPFAVQTLMLVEKSPEGKVTTKALMPVRFVPLLGAGAKEK